MEDHCNECKINNHCNGHGTLVLFDQDGIDRIVCRCDCGRVFRKIAIARYRKEILGITIGRKRVNG